MRTVEEIKVDIEKIKDTTVTASVDTVFLINKWGFLEQELIKSIINNIPLDRLEEVCNAEREGRVKVLPCKVEDVVYKISYDCTNGIRYNPYGENGCSTALICLRCNTYPCDLHRAVIPDIAKNEDWIWKNKSDFGKTVFLSQAEAEKALKEREQK